NADTKTLRRPSAQPTLGRQPLAERDVLSPLSPHLTRTWGLFLIPLPSLCALYYPRPSQRPQSGDAVLNPVKMRLLIDSFLVQDKGRNLDFFNCKKYLFRY